MRIEICGASSNPHGSLPFSRDILKTDHLGQEINAVLQGPVIKLVLQFKRTENDGADQAASWLRAWLLPGKSQKS